ncbi:hypothetical protein JOC75_000999 [Metabacillus crassostreae]|uniref:hypothetical protein n=1 Tax=Metabacillus crassostreae TaxID=929098 RepID=UPI001958DB28|nr:hypothetical protein [Metabacillus crassostreae]MBM7603029.1 hypothetical protein [Metabacillus crassostreae]
MRDFLEVLIPSWRQVLYSLLAFFIPFFMFSISHILYEKGNPSWKKESSQEQDE